MKIKIKLKENKRYFDEPTKDAFEFRRTMAVVGEPGSAIPLEEEMAILIDLYFSDRDAYEIQAGRWDIQLVPIEIPQRVLEDIWRDTMRDNKLIGGEVFELQLSEYIEDRLIQMQALSPEDMVLKYEPIGDKFNPKPKPYMKDTEFDHLEEIIDEELKSFYDAEKKVVPFEIHIETDDEEQTRQVNYDIPIPADLDPDDEDEMKKYLYNNFATQLRLQPNEVIYDLHQIEQGGVSLQYIDDAPEILNPISKKRKTKEPFDLLEEIINEELEEAIKRYRSIEDELAYDPLSSDDPAAKEKEIRRLADKETEEFFKQQDKKWGKVTGKRAPGEPHPKHNEEEVLQMFAELEIKRREHAIAFVDVAIEELTKIQPEIHRGDRKSFLRGEPNPKIAKEQKTPWDKKDIPHLDTSWVGDAHNPATVRRTSQNMDWMTQATPDQIKRAKRILAALGLRGEHQKSAMRKHAWDNLAYKDSFRKIAIQNVLKTKKYDPDPSDGPGGPKDFMFLLKQHLANENIQMKLHDFYVLTHGGSGSSPKHYLKWGKKITVDKHGGKELDLRFDSEKWKWETKSENQWLTPLGKRIKKEKEEAKRRAEEYATRRAKEEEQKAALISEFEKMGIKKEPGQWHTAESNTLEGYLVRDLKDKLSKKSKDIKNMNLGQFERIYLGKNYENLSLRGRFSYTRTLLWNYLSVGEPYQDYYYRSAELYYDVLAIKAHISIPYQAYDYLAQVRGDIPFEKLSWEITEFTEETRDL